MCDSLLHSRPMRHTDTNHKLFIVLALFLFSTAPVNGQHAGLLEKTFEAHGELSNWQSFGSLSFDLVRGEESVQHIIDLYSRKSRQSTDAYSIGYDGSNAWVAPNADAFPGNPGFYNGLHFYFFAMPFVFADPGVQKEQLEPREVGGKTYDVVQITYEDGVGGSSKDTYLAHIDPSTNQLRFLLYTVTYSSGEPSTNYNAMVYEDWQEVQGLLVPRKIVSHPWDKDKGELGQARGAMEFDNIVFDAAAPEASVFEKPDEGVYAGDGN